MLNELDSIQIEEKNGKKCVNFCTYLVKLIIFLAQSQKINHF